VQIQRVSPEIAESLGLEKAAGALVSEPQPNSPAAKAGIESGDVITAVDDNTVSDARDLARRIGTMALSRFSRVPSSCFSVSTTLMPLSLSVARASSICCGVISSEGMIALSCS
jgi:membrane-associated protease RseP (regulator of RpoE activity)